MCGNTVRSADNRLTKDTAAGQWRKLHPGSNVVSNGKDAMNHTLRRERSDKNEETRTKKEGKDPERSPKTDPANADPDKLLAETIFLDNCATILYRKAPKETNCRTVRLRVTLHHEIET